MRYRFFERVVLEHDLPEYDLRAGDVGTVVEIYAPDGLEVEFMSASGETQAIATLSEDDVRKAGKNDMLAVRPLSSSA